MKSAPCMNCPDRVVGCHSKCEKYAEFKEHCNKIGEIKHQFSLEYQHRIEQVQKTKRKK